MTVGDMLRAKRLALQLFDEWNDVAGIFHRGSSYYGEIESVIEDAVECGAGFASRLTRKEILKRIKQ